MVAEDDKAIYFRFGTELVDDWDKVFTRIHDQARKTQEQLNRARFKMPAIATDEALQSQLAYMQKSQDLHSRYFNGRSKDFERMAKEQQKWDDQISKAQDAANSEAVSRERKFQAELTKQQEARNSLLEKQQKAGLARMTKEQLRADDEIEAAQAQANAEALARQNKAHADAEKAAAKHSAQMLKEEKALADDVLKLSSSLANAKGTWDKRMADEAEAAQAKAAKAVETSGRKMEDSLLKAGKGAVEVARGLTYLGAANEDTAQAALKLIVTFEAVHSTAKGGITIVRGLADAWSRYRDVKLAVAAAEVAAAAAGGIRGGSAAGSAAGSVASGVAGAAGRAIGGAAGGAAGGAGGIVGGAVGVVGGAAGVAAIGAAAVAAVGVVGTLYYFDKNFNAGVDKFLYGITDAEQKVLSRIGANETETGELRGRRAADRNDELTIQGADDEMIRQRARARVLADKSVPLEELGVRTSQATNSDLIANREAKLRKAMAVSQADAANARDNPNHPQALAAAETSAQRVVDLTRDLQQLEQERLGIAEQIQQTAVAGLNKQLDSARATADAMRQTADEAARIAAEETGKYRSDLERFGAADPVEQDRLRRIKSKIDSGESLTAEESSLARGYNEFSEQAAASDRSRALAAGGEALFGNGEARIADAQAQAAASGAAAIGAQGSVARIENEIRILMDFNKEDLARQIAEQLGPANQETMDAIVDQIEKRRLADAKANADRLNKRGIEAGRS